MSNIVAQYLAQTCFENAMNETYHYKFLKTRSKDEILNLCQSTMVYRSNNPFMGAMMIEDEIRDDFYKENKQNFAKFRDPIQYLCSRKVISKDRYGNLRKGPSIFGSMIKPVLKKKQMEDLQKIREKKDENLFTKNEIEKEKTPVTEITEYVPNDAWD
jgi:hypothetical protein